MALELKGKHFISTNNYLYIEFNSDSSINERGFKADFSGRKLQVYFFVNLKGLQTFVPAVLLYILRLVPYLSCYLEVKKRSKRLNELEALQRVVGYLSLPLEDEP